MCNHQNACTDQKDQELILRKPQVDDARKLIEYMKLVDSETKFLAREPGEFTLTVDQEIDFIKKAQDNKNMEFLVCEIEGEIAGNCSVGRISNNKRFSHRASMGLSVQKKYWGRGIGRKLMEACIDWCQNNGIEQLELEVVTSNERAKAMYEKLGFQLQGTKKHAMKYADGTYADEYQMVRFIGE
ncbi:GNAT family N-acetyltransferase [Fusibacter sp. JL216-2]|uniref:GNAT family N-acetyltransferase n=1 Tax=Fusibacter sp. JL216-2 TaxID=3071453 RepID=UPI003D331B2B